VRRESLLDTQRRCRCPDPRRPSDTLVGLPGHDDRASRSTACASTGDPASSARGELASGSQTLATRASRALDGRLRRASPGAARCATSASPSGRRAIRVADELWCAFWRLRGSSAARAGTDRRSSSRQVRHRARQSARNSADHVDIERGLADDQLAASAKNDRDLVGERRGTADIVQILHRDAWTAWAPAIIAPRLEASRCAARRAPARARTSRKRDHLVAATSVPVFFCTSLMIGRPLRCPGWRDDA